MNFFKYNNIVNYNVNYDTKFSNLNPSSFIILTNECSTFETVICNNIGILLLICFSY